MRATRKLILAGITGASLCVSPVVWAQASGPPSADASSPLVVVPHGDTDLPGVPKDIKPLIISFDQTRDKYLAAQDQLLAQLKHATTAAEREQIRKELQANRQAFLDALKSFRQQLKDELAALKGKISHEEFLRIIDAAHNASTEGGIGHHKGH
jgi:hypothetical protein